MTSAILYKLQYVHERYFCNFISSNVRKTASFVAYVSWHSLIPFRHSFSVQYKIDTGMRVRVLYPQDKIGFFLQVIKSAFLCHQFFQYLIHTVKLFRKHFHQWHTRLRLVCHFSVLTTFWRHLWSITEQTHGNLDSICLT